MKHLRKPIAILLTLALILGLLPAALAASPATVSSKALEQTEEAPAPNGMNVHTPYGLKLGSGAETRGETKDLPAYYNSADLGLVTSVKNQTQYGQYGTCWAFGTLSPIETYMIKNQMPAGDGAAATTALDLSEYHLSYFTYSNSHDEHGLTDGDSSILQGESHLNVGGDGYKATLTLMRWIGPASEEEADLAYSEASPSGVIDPKYAYAYDVGHVTSVDWIEPSDTALVKQYLQEFGSAFIGYYYSAAYQGTGGAYCYISTSASNDYGPNHGVTLVGWDDNYSKANFTGLSKPTNNGAWIVKNSWGNNAYTDNGYTYISYEDTSYLGHPIMFFTVDGLDTYDHLYQYDGTCFTGNEAKGWIPLTQNRSLVSNVFTAAGHETVEAFSICTLEEDLGYTLQVYKNPTNLSGSSPDPTSGALMSTQTGTIAHSGYHTIPIASPFKVEAGDKFSAVFTLDSQQSAASFQMVIPVDESETEDYTENGSYLATLVHTHVSHPGTSFFRLRDNSTWSQLDNGASLRIKAYTSDAPFELTVTAGAHGTAVLGDYTAQGYRVTASPESGYYTSGYAITAGNAAVIQNGNVFYVNPTETTSIRIDFAPQSPFTLTYSVNGEAWGSAVTGMTGDAVTLPASAPAYEGYTFLGWATSPVPEAVTGKPLCLEPGVSYYPLGGNTTLYALYAFDRLAVPGQDGSYVKITSSNEFTEGRYLVVNESALRALDGSKASSSGMWAPINTAPNYVDVTISGGRIPDTAEARAADFHYDPSTRQFYSAYGYPVGGYKNNYYFYVWGSSSTSASQTVSFDASGNAVIKDDYYNNTLRYNAAATAYFAYLSSGGDSVQLYRKTDDTTTTYYSTLFDAAPAVTWTVSFNSNGGSTVPTQSVVEGQTVVRPADPTKTGFTFAGWYSDAALTQAYDFTTPVTSSFTLYAKWTEAAAGTWTVTFNSNGGSPVAAQTVENGQTAVRPADPTKTDFTFAGWYSDAALTQAYDFSAPVTASFTLYAKWEAEAPAVTYTVTFMTNGRVTGTQEVQANASLTLPAEATAFEGWSFRGWTETPTEETETAPVWYAPGASFTPSADVTLHALYSRSESGGAAVYELLSAAPADWSGSYVISYGVTTSMYLMKGVTPSSNGASIENDVNAVSYANSGASLSGTTLSNVPETCVFDFAPQGSYYAVKSRSANTWLGVSTSSYLAAYTEYNSSYCNWTPGTGSNASSLKNAFSGSYPYVSYTSSGNKFWTSAYVNTSVRLWKGSQTGVTCWTTVIAGQEPAEPIETSELRIVSSISVGTDMVVTWSARKTDVQNYAKFWIEVIKHAPDGDEVYTYGAEQPEALNEGSTAWSADFKHIFAKEMGVEIEARLYAQDANGQIYMSPAKTTNIRDYLGGRLTATNNSVEQRTLAADMLNYGAAAQMFMDYDTEHLVNEELTAEQLAKLDEYETKDLPAVNKTNSNYRPEGQSNILFNSVSLDNEVILTLIVRANQGDTVKILMKNHDSGVVLETLNAEWNGSNFSVDYTGIGADKMRVAYDFTAVINEAETGNTRTWSVEGYVGEIRGGSNQYQIDVANALLTYGDSAAAYFAAQ